MFKTAKKRSLALGKCSPRHRLVRGQDRATQPGETGAMFYVSKRLANPFTSSLSNGHSFLEMRTNTTLNARYNRKHRLLCECCHVDSTKWATDISYSTQSKFSSTWLPLLSGSFRHSQPHPSILSPIFFLWCAFQTLTFPKIPWGTDPKIQPLILLVQSSVPTRVYTHSSGQMTEVRI